MSQSKKKGKDTVHTANIRNKLRGIKSEIELWKPSFNKNRRIEVILSRAKIGRTHLMHSYLMEGGTDSPVCNKCNMHIAVNIFLWNALNFC